MKISEVLANPDDASLYQIFGEPQMDLLKNIVESNGFRFFWLDGNQISCIDQFYDEIITVLEFPFFGQNFNALYDCLSDLEWLSGKGFVLYYTDYANLLNIAPHDFDTILYQIRLNDGCFAPTMGLNPLFQKSINHPNSVSNPKRCPRLLVYWFMAQCRR